MKEDKIVNGYYESKIKTSRNEDSVYAMKYASQQMIIDKLESNWKELKMWCEKELQILEKHNYRVHNKDLIIAVKTFIEKMQELENK